MKQRSIIHIDMDAFFAAIEVRDNPSLRGKPLIIGALPSERGVVSTCSYEARKFGIHSAMNIKEAYRRCPHGIFMHGNMWKYARASAEIHEIMLKYTDKIEFVALDEGYMDVTASLKLFGGAEAIGTAIKREIKDKVGVTCSVGISYSKMSAKIASEEKKPNGFFVIPDKQALLELIGPRRLGVINGVGKKTEERFNRLGIYTVNDLLCSPPEIVLPFKAVGREILKLASGNDDREVVAESEAKSIGREHTFQKDIEDVSVLEDFLVLLAKDVSLRLKNSGLWAHTVTVKIKFSDMKGITRSKSVGAISSAREVLSLAKELLKEAKISRSVRLIGISLSNLTDTEEGESEQISLFEVIEPEEDTRKSKAKALDNAVYSVHKQFGSAALKTARELKVINRYWEKKSDKK